MSILGLHDFKRAVSIQKAPGVGTWFSPTSHYNPFFVKFTHRVNPTHSRNAWVFTRITGQEILFFLKGLVNYKYVILELSEATLPPQEKNITKNRANTKRKQNRTREQDHVQMTLSDCLVPAISEGRRTHHHWVSIYNMCIFLPIIHIYKLL